MACLPALILVLLAFIVQKAHPIAHRPPSIPIGADWLRTMPSGQDWTPPASPTQPVVEVHFKTCKPGVDVVEYLYAEVRKKNLGKGTDTNDSIRKWVQKDVGYSFDDAGHIVGKNQGGLGTVKWNIFPQSRNFNRGVYARDVERMVNDATKIDGVVQMWFQFVYGNSSMPCRPTEFRYYLLTKSISVSNNLENPVKVKIAIS